VILEAHPSARAVETLPVHDARWTRFRRFPHATRPERVRQLDWKRCQIRSKKNLETLPNREQLSAEAESNVNTLFVIG
jgi:hypothetical protein